MNVQNCKYINFYPNFDTLIAIISDYDTFFPKMERNLEKIVRGESSYQLEKLLQKSHIYFHRIY